MELRSTFNKGNIIQVYDLKAKENRLLEVKDIESWSKYTGFIYTISEYKSFLEEKYDDIDFVSQFDVCRVFKDVLEYRGWLDEQDKSN